MTESLINIDVAQYLTSLGIEIPSVKCFAMIDGKIRDEYWFDALNENEFLYFQPTQSIVQKYFRNIHDLHYSVDCNHSGWYWLICKTNGTSVVEQDDCNYFSSYEDALNECFLQNVKLI